MGRSRESALALAIAAVMAVPVSSAGCAGLVDESSRPCPCVPGYVCCLNECVPETQGCADASATDAPNSKTSSDAPNSGMSANDLDVGALDASVNETSGDSTIGEGSPDAQASGWPDAPADTGSTVDAPHSDATGDAMADAVVSMEAGGSADAPIGDAAAEPDVGAVDASAADMAPRCSYFPPPRVHFPFGDCADAGIVRDTASGASAVFEGAGVLCDHSPVGGAIRFRGDNDAGSGGYVRVMDSLDAGAPACGDGGVCPANWPFKNAITVSALLDVTIPSSLENIVGQWFFRDSYIFNTFYDNGLREQIVRFSVQPAGLPQPVNASAPFLPPSGQQHAWSHWVGVYDGTAITLYQDGHVVQTQALDAGGSPQCTNVPLELGAVGRQGPCSDLSGSDFAGAIGDLQIFDYALSVDEVRAVECSIGWP